MITYMYIYIHINTSFKLTDIGFLIITITSIIFNNINKYYISCNFY